MGTTTFGAWRFQQKHICGENFIRHDLNNVADTYIFPFRFDESSIAEDTAFFIILLPVRIATFEILSEIFYRAYNHDEHQRNENVWHASRSRYIWNQLQQTDNLKTRWTSKTEWYDDANIPKSRCLQALRTGGADSSEGNWEGCICKSKCYCRRGPGPDARS